MIRIFISSVQKELAVERARVRDYVRGSSLLSRYFEVFLFEEVPASDIRADELYLDQVAECDLYLGLFGYEYGWEDEEGLSPTHREFREATRRHKQRFIFVKGDEEELREEKMRGLIHEASDQLIRRRFVEEAELIRLLEAALVQYLEEQGLIQNLPFDAAPCPGATLSDLDETKIKQFAESTLQNRLLDTSPLEVLTHLNLLSDQIPTHAAILLFGTDPQRFLISATVKCAHFHTLEVVKPIPSAHEYRGTVFDLIEQSVDFVMSKINRSVGTRADGVTAPIEYEIPREVVAEGIINAVAHRNYASNGSVQVMLFPDRLEISNPGTLPSSMTLEDLRGPHISVPANPHLADPLSRTSYVERLGTGTRDMIRRCSEVELREPEFLLNDGFMVRIFRKTGQLRAPNGQVTGQHGGQDDTKTGQVTGQDTGQVEPWIFSVLEACRNSPLKSKEIQEIAGIRHRESFQRNYLDLLLREGWVTRTIPDKPTSRNQKYQITEKGLAHLPPPSS